MRLIFAAFSAAVFVASAEAAPAAPVASASVARPVFAGESDDAVVARIFSYLDSVTTLKGAFTQTAPSGALSEGAFYLKRPGFIRFDYAPPTPLKIVANGGLVYVRDEKLETTDSYPLGQTPLKFLLRKKVDFADLRIDSVEREADEVAITISSKDPKTEGELVAIFAAPALSLKQWIVRDAQGGSTIISLHDVVAGEDIPNRTFAAPETSSPFLKDR